MLVAETSDRKIRVISSPTHFEQEHGPDVYTILVENQVKQTDLSAEETIRALVHMMDKVNVRGS